MKGVWNPTLYLLCSIPFGIQLLTTWAAHKSCSYPYEQNIWTQYRTLTEELDKAVLAVWLVILLLEGSFVKLLKAKGTDKVLGMELLPHSGDTTASDGLLAARTQRSTAFVIMNLTVWLPVVFKETPINKWSKAFPANKALRVPQSVQSRYIILQDGMGASTTFGGKHVKVILTTIGLTIPLMEAFWAKKCSALCTEEMFRMPCSI